MPGMRQIHISRTFQGNWNSAREKRFQTKRVNETEKIGNFYTETLVLVVDRTPGPGSVAWGKSIFKTDSAGSLLLAWAVCAPVLFLLFFYLCSREFSFSSESNKENWIKTSNKKEPSKLKFFMNLINSNLLIHRQI